MDIFSVLLEIVKNIFELINAVFALLTGSDRDNDGEESGVAKVVFIVLLILLAVFLVSRLFVGNEPPPEPSEAPSESVAEQTEPETQAPEIPEAAETTETTEAEADTESVSVRIGDVITFGAYEQDNRAGNGAEPIEWLVLDRDGDYVLVISKYALVHRKFHSTKTPVTWEDCDLRQWLNDEFFYDAFSAEERERIRTSIVFADRNPEYDNDPGGDTLDKVFVLSTEEAAEYFSSNADRLCFPTAYALTHPQLYISDVGSVWWWLRTPGENTTDATTVNSNGRIDYKDGRVNSETGTVRPAMWIKVS